MRHKLLLLTIVLALHSPLNAQLWDWAKGGGADQGVDICSDRIGGLYVASTRGNSPFINYPMTYTQTGEIISRHHLNGNIIWAQKIILGNIAAISADRFGNCYATGSCNSATFTGGQGNIVINHPGDYQAYTVKYDYSGNVQWVKFWDYPNSSDGGGCIKTDDIGNTIVAGSDSKNFYQGGPSSNFFLLKYDNQGSLLWSKTSNWKGNFGAGGIDIDNFGNIYVYGTYNDSACFGNVTLYTSTYSSIFLAKYDKNGNLMWAKRVGTNYDYATRMVLDSKGFLYFTGMHSGPSVFGNVTLNPSGAFIAKADTGGTIIWARHINAKAGNAVCKDVVNGCSITGIMGPIANFPGNPGITLTTNIQTDVFVAKYDSIGNCIWAVNPSGTPNRDANWPTSIVSDNNSHYYLTGSCGQITAFDTHSLSTGGVFIARLSPLPVITPGTGTANIVSSISENSKDQLSFSVYPNPTTGQVFVSFLNSNSLRNISLQVKDVIGQSIYEKSYDIDANEFIQEINLGHLPKGIYFVEVTADKAKEVRRIIVE